MNTGCFPGMTTKNQRRAASFSAQYRPTSGPSTESGPAVSLTLRQPPRDQHGEGRLGSMPPRQAPPDPACLNDSGFVSSACDLLKSSLFPNHSKYHQRGAPQTSPSGTRAESAHGPTAANACLAGFCRSRCGRPSVAGCSRALVGGCVLATDPRASSLSAQGHGRLCKTELLGFVSSTSTGRLTHQRAQGWCCELELSERDGGFCFWCPTKDLIPGSHSTGSAWRN